MFDTIKGKKKKDEGPFACYKEEEIKAKLGQGQPFESEKLDNICRSKNKENKELKKIFVDFFEKNNPIAIKAFGYTLFIPESVYCNKDKGTLRKTVKDILYKKINFLEKRKMSDDCKIAVYSNGMWGRNEKILKDNNIYGEDISIILPQFSYRIKNMDKDVEKRSDFLNTFIREVYDRYNDLRVDNGAHVEKQLPPVDFCADSYANYPVHRYFINFLKSQRECAEEKKIHCALHSGVLGRVPILGDFLANLIGYQTSDDLLNLFGQLNINDIDLIDSIECETFINNQNMNGIRRLLHPYEYTKKYAESLANHELFKNTDKVFFDNELISNDSIIQNSMAGNNSVDKQLNKSQNFEEINMQFGAINNNMRELTMGAINDMSFGAINNNNMRGLTMGEINKIREQLNNDKKSAEGANNNKKQDFYRSCNNQISKHRKKPEIQIPTI